MSIYSRGSHAMSIYSRLQPDDEYLDSCVNHLTMLLHDSPEFTTRVLQCFASMTGTNLSVLVSSSVLVFSSVSSYLTTRCRQIPAAANRPQRASLEPAGRHIDRPPSSLHPARRQPGHEHCQRRGRGSRCGHRAHRGQPADWPHVSRAVTAYSCEGWRAPTRVESAAD